MRSISLGYKPGNPFDTLRTESVGKMSFFSYAYML